MEIIENNKIKENLYIEKLENGLTIMVLPRKNVRKKYIICGPNFGSIDNKFIIPGNSQETVLPDGVAHFLEHKMFEQKSGINSLDTLTAIGVSANAYTTNDHTAYLYEATDNFYEALDEYMDYIQNPYYTDENVEKEKGIIAQEIKMYEDYPEWQVYLNTLKCMYKELPIRLDIAGTVESISGITKEMLYDCYNNFYTPSNMVMAICGDFNPKEIIEEIKKRITIKENKELPKRIYPNEPEEICEKEKTVKMELSNPIFAIGFKDKVEKDMVKKHIAIEIILNTLFGKSSKLYKELTDTNILLGSLDLEYEYSKEYAFILITGQSREPRKVYERINEEIENAMKNGLNADDFERNKKMIYGDYIADYNSVEDTARMFLADYFKGVNSFEYLEEYENVTVEYANEILRSTLKLDKEVLSIVEGK